MDKEKESFIEDDQEVMESSRFTDLAAYASFANHLYADQIDINDAMEAFEAGRKQMLENGTDIDDNGASASGTYASTLGMPITTQRAQEIASSPNMKHVTHQGTPVYIQHVDENAQTARIYPLSKPEQELDVPLSSLLEHQS